LDVVAHIPSLRRLRQENHELKISLGYLVSLCFKKKKKVIFCMEVEGVEEKVGVCFALLFPM
jgi:hypothetical protein